MKKNVREKSVNKAPVSNIKKVELDLDTVAGMLGGYCYNNQLMMANITALNTELQDNRTRHNAIRMDVWCSILITAGTLTLNLNFKKITVSKGSLVLLSPFDSIDSTTLSPDGRYYVIMVKKDFMDDSMAKKKAVPLGNILSTTKRKLPVISLEDKEMEAIKRNFDTIYYYLRAERGEYKGYLLRSAYYMLTVEFIVLINNKIKLYEKESSKRSANEKSASRKEEIILKFMVLLHKWAESEHAPSFYADKLFISVQYLSLILKENTGHTTSYWIANEIIRIAKNMLNIPNCTISQVTEQLHFADQSSFGKFFKKHTGLSPKKYMDNIY